MSGQGRTLHSHAFNYGHPGSSGQQQVTAFEGADDNDWWRVKGPDGQSEDFQQGQPIANGDVVRLQHAATARNLHSHAGFPSPVTGQQEVTCFGENGIGDGNDNWRVETGGGAWQGNRRIKLIHVPTDCALHSHSGHSHAQWTRGQQEVTCYQWRDDNDWWLLLEVA
jgi:dolichyl-phosphate-mannose--protein O-mannosyl transferase